MRAERKEEGAAFVEVETDLAASQHALRRSQSVLADVREAPLSSMK